jgi:hypothetical protein
LAPLVTCYKLEYLNLSRNKLSILLEDANSADVESGGSSDGEMDTLPSNLTHLDVSYNEPLCSLEGLVSWCALCKCILLSDGSHHNFIIASTAQVGGVQLQSLWDNRPIIDCPMHQTSASIHEQ